MLGAEVTSHLDFISSSPLRRHPTLGKILLFGADIDDHTAREAIEWGVAARKSWKRSNRSPLSLQDLRELLISVVSDSMKAHTDQTLPVLGVSAGFDSRAILYGLQQLHITPRLYTYGTPGNFDFDFIRALATRNNLAVEFFDYSQCAWSVAAHEAHVREENNIPANLQVLARSAVAETFPHHAELHGYFNDGITTAQRRHPRWSRWSTAVSDFVARNNPFALQELVPDGVTQSLISSRPLAPSAQMRFAMQLSFGYRQWQKISPSSTPDRRIITPFVNDQWVGYWLSQDTAHIKGQVAWINFLRRLEDPLFFDLDGKAGYTRAQLLTLNAKAIYPGGVPHQTHRGFSFTRCYTDNPSFRSLVDEGVSRLRSRRVLYKSFIDNTVAAFPDGGRKSEQRMNLLIKLDAALESGRI